MSQRCADTFVTRNGRSVRHAPEPKLRDGMYWLGIFAVTPGGGRLALAKGSTRDACMLALVAALQRLLK